MAKRCAASTQSPAAARDAASASQAPSQILRHPVAYCVVLPPSYDAEKTRRYPVLYLLHGLGDNEQMLLRSGGFSLVQDLWENQRMGEFLIVTPAGGTRFTSTRSTAACATKTSLCGS